MEHRPTNLFRPIFRTRIGKRLHAARGLVRSSELALVIIAALVGVSAGLMVTVMSRLVQFAHEVLFGIDLNARLSAAVHIPFPQIVLWPVVGGMILGVSFWLLARFKRPSAVDPIEANALRGGQMPTLDSLVVAFQTLASSSFGASVGLEAGYTQVGSGFASWAGQRLKLRRSDLRVLVGAGAAGAIAAAFSAPLTGAFYGFEVVIGAYAVANVAPVMAASICGMLVSQALGGALYHIEVRAGAPVTNLDYVLFLGLGILCAGLAITMMRGVSLIERAFTHKWMPQILRPALGGLVIGGLAMITPQVLSAGHGALQFDLGTTQGLKVLLGLAALKMLASSVSLGSGFRGGLFFASLLIGALLGQAYAEVALIAAHVQIDPISAALVGMGAFAVAIVGGPLTMAFLVLETTGDYALTGAVLATCVVSSLIVREAFGYSFSTWRLHLRGESIRSAHDVGWIRSLTVGRLMRKDPALAPAGITLKEFRHRFPLGSRQRAVLTGENDAYAGIVMVADAYADGLDEASPVLALARVREAVLLPTMNVKEAMRLFDETEMESLPVVDSLQDRKVIGLLNETHAVRRYAEELDKSRREMIGEPSAEGAR
jgi:CIC family chloride channel protein